MATLKSTLTLAIIRLLKPIVRILLRHGVSHAEFSELAKFVYVDVSENEFLIEGRKQSVSRICVLTGLHRKDVNKIREKLGEDLVELEQLGRSARVISGWREDNMFHDPQGKIIELPMDGDISFTALVKRYSGDMPVRAVLDELMLSGSVTVNEDNKIELIRDTYIPTQSDDGMLRIMGVSAADMLNTIDYNLSRKSSEDSRLQLVVDYKKIPLSKIAAFKKYSQSEALAMIKSFDRWLGENADIGESEEETKRLGFGIYYFENDIEGVQDENNE